MNRVAEEALDRALDHDEDLLLLYQPIHEIPAGSITAAEALLRQRRSSGEIREATIIARAAEKRGGEDLFTLDSRLIRRATEDAAGWQAHAPVALNFNLSPREFDRPDVVHRLAGLITSTGIDPRLVNVEITETSAARDPAEMRSVLEKLHARGLRLWLDDFGSGHSSLSHLLHFPLDGLKIAGEFVRALSVNPKARSIIRGVIALAHETGLSVTAEEVEEREQLEILTEAGCDSVQGFLFSRPMPAARLAELVRGSTPPSSPDSPPARNDRDASRGPSSRSA